MRLCYNMNLQEKRQKRLENKMNVISILEKKEKEGKITETEKKNLKRTIQNYKKLSDVIKAYSLKNIEKFSFCNTFEKEQAIQANDLNIKWERLEINDERTLSYLDTKTNKTRQYVSDLYLPDFDIHIEVKSKKQLKSRKVKDITKHNKNIILVENGKVFSENKLIEVKQYVELCS